ncbi:uncharacterized protein ASPGLDRAFT_53272 [Aspergillus glaucus CBS 516.65]|uniref:Pectate lyase n=1 Tax=Aspergillus glaucus CBS 516.65 TaxID=1160497 RepID=A0A1L9V4G9_ASPGL|nr:hypothetical protein ASPGLDRAFT_53272 [Aspergillus glaucus CBS 516.65]OJJ78843.1 hypothetical protein ASPGLDRAFT_53272 [Aspergillus glaucus CBS 516.65]
MQFTIVSVIAALAATAIAVPVPGENHHPTAKANFIGAADASFTQDFKTDGTYTAINNVLSISKISVPAGVKCTFHGIDGGVTKVSDRAVVDVGPPQTQVSGACWNL